MAFAIILCFSFYITNVNHFLLNPYFRSSQFFSFFLPFSHFPTNHASILLRSFLNLLIFVSIFLFQKNYFFFLAFGFFMPTSSPTIFFAARMTFLQCVKPVIFICSNTLFILITFSLIFSLYPCFRFPSVLPKSLPSNASLNLESLSLLESLKSFLIILMCSSFAQSAWLISTFSSLMSAMLSFSWIKSSLTSSLLSFSIFVLIVSISMFVTQPLDLIILI